MKLSNLARLTISIAVSEFAGIVGSFFTMPSIRVWYADLIKPTINPPAWIFGPVWTTLFLLMGIAAFLIWMEDPKRKDVRIALAIFALQLILNISWSIIFFGLHSPGAALIEIIFLWLSILATIIAFYKILKTAAWLLTPYLAWVSFAALLNYLIWRLN